MPPDQTSSFETVLDAPPAGSPPAAPPAPVPPAPPAADAAPAPGSPPAPPPAPPAPPAQKAEKPKDLPDTYWDAEKGAVKTDDLIKAANDLAASKKDVITDLAAVKLTPTVVKDYYGKDIKLDAEAPIVKAMLGLAKEEGLRAGTANKLVDLVLQAQVASQEADAKEFAKIGDNAEARFKAAAAKAATQLGYTGTAGPDGKVDESMKVRAQNLFSRLDNHEDFLVLEELLGLKAGPTAAEAGGAGGVVPFANRLYPEDAKKSAGAR